jgi:hypothetical protein
MLRCVKSVPNSQDDRPPFGSHFDPTWGYISLFSTTYMWDPQLRLSSTSDCYTHRPPLGVAAPCAASAGASREAGAVQAPLLSPKPATQFHLLSLAVAATPPIGRSNFIFSSSGRSNLLTLPPRKLTNSPRRTRQIMARPPARPSCPSHGVCSSLCRLRSEKQGEKTSRFG